MRCSTPPDSDPEHQPKYRLCWHNNDKYWLLKSHRSPRRWRRWHVTIDNQDDEKVAEYELLTMNSY